jgi:hypothetical protein
MMSAVGGGVLFAIDVHVDTKEIRYRSAYDPGQPGWFTVSMVSERLLLFLQAQCEDNEFKHRLEAFLIGSMKNIVREGGENNVAS